MLENLKLMLGIDDTDRDALLELIVSLTTSRLTNLLGGIEPPKELDYIIVGVSIARYNRIGSEGVKSHTVEGESMTFEDSDFDEYSEDIQTFLDSRKESTRGKVRFL